MFSHASARAAREPWSPDRQENLRRAALRATSLVANHQRRIFTARILQSRSHVQFVQIKADLYQAIAVSGCESDARRALALMTLLLQQPAATPPARLSWATRLHRLLLHTRKRWKALARPAQTVAIPAPPHA